MSKILLIILLLFVSFFSISNVQGQGRLKKNEPAPKTASPNLFPLYRYGQWSFIDVTGKTIIKPQFEYAGEFSNGLALVRIGGKYGYIDETGTFAINPQFDGDVQPVERMSFREGLAAVRVEAKIGYINKAGKFVIKPQFDDAFSFSEGLAEVKIQCKDKFMNWDCGEGYVNRRGKWFKKLPTGSSGRSFSENLAAVRDVNGKWGFIDKFGRTVIESQFDLAYSFSEGLASVVVGKKSGFINRMGKFVISPKYDEMFGMKFSEGLARVQENGMYGYIDKSGQYVIRPQYDYANDFSHGLASVRNEKHINYRIDKSGRVIKKLPGSFTSDNVLSSLKGKFIAFGKGETDTHAGIGGASNFKGSTVGGYLDEDGHYVVNPNLEQVSGFADGMGQVLIDSKWGYIDEKGKVVIPPRFEDAYSFSEGLARVVVNRHVGFIDKAGNFVIQPRFEETGVFSNGLAYVFINGKYGYIDKSGSVTINPSFDQASSYSEGLAMVKVDDKFGFIDTYGRFVIKPQFEDADSFSEGLAGVKIEGKFGFINKAGIFVINPSFDNERYYTDLEERLYYAPKDFSFSEGLAAVQVGNKWGFIDKTGRFAIKPQFGFAKNFTDGMAWVQPSERKGRVQWACINKSGDFVIPFSGISDSYLFAEGLSWVDIRGAYFLIDKNFDPHDSESFANSQSYDDVRSFSEGLALVRIGNKFGYINRTGKYVWNPTK